MKIPKEIRKRHHKVPQRQYDQFRKFLPISCVDLIIPNHTSILLTKRTIPPYKGKWHLPGGIVHKNEKLIDAAKRIAKEELNVDIRIKKFVGTYENLLHFRHDISHCFLAYISNGKIEPNYQSSQIKFFSNVPKNIIPYHLQIIDDARKYLKTK